MTTPTSRAVGVECDRPAVESDRSGELMRAQITLRSGVQIEVDVTELTTGRHRFTRDLVSLDWTTPQGWTRKLHTIELSEIAAIVMIQERGA